MRLILCTAFFILLSLFSLGQTIPGPNPGDTGSVVFTYRGNNVVYKTVRAADGKVWLQQNLGATKVADSLKDVAAYGDLFQWGRWDDGHQIRTSALLQTNTLPANNPTGLGNGIPEFLRSNPSPEWWAGGNPGTDTWGQSPASATNGIDPCIAVGPGWHTPDSSDWGQLIRSENITNPATAFASHLKLTLAGTRTTFGSMSNVGIAGAYHSRTLHHSSMSSQYFQIHESTNNVNNTVAGPRSYGRSCRCVEGCFDPPVLGNPEGADTACVGSMQTYVVPGAPSNVQYIWTLPVGWVGTVTANSVTATVGSMSGLLDISVASINNCGDTGIRSSFQVYVPPFARILISVSRDTLFASGGNFQTWQWYRDGNLIPGATDSFYIVPENDRYTVKATDRFGCTDSTDIPYIVTNLGIPSVREELRNIHYYPNPANSLVYFDTGKPINARVYTSDGREVLHAEKVVQLNIKDLPPGIYILSLSDQNGILMGRGRLIKISEAIK